MTKSTNKLTIQWQMQDPPVAPKGWISMRGVDQGSQSDTEKDLGLPSGTIATLGAALKENYSRSTGWLIASGDEAASTASRVYKRGVACSPNRDQLQATTQNGKYEITFHDGVPAFSNCTFVDEEVRKAWPKAFSASPIHPLRSSELTKNLDTVAKMCVAARNCQLITAVGGGILCDMAGFAAGLLNKPIQFVPTTLLAMADACVGGKTGVNFSPFGKNQVGMFYFPEKVQIWPGWLQSLPAREFRAGLSECLKHAMIKSDPDLLARVSAWQKPGDISSADLREVIKLKAQVVEKDPGESGYRAVLNYGHTLAHALEALSHENRPNDYLLHGEAVGFGLSFANFVGKEEGLLDEATYHLWDNALKDSGACPSKLLVEEKIGAKLTNRKTLAQLADFMLRDKKSSAPERITMTLVDHQSQMFSKEFSSKDLMSYMERLYLPPTR